jgi:hypothetical protein
LLAIFNSVLVSFLKLVGLTPNASIVFRLWINFIYYNHDKPNLGNSLICSSLFLKRTRLRSPSSSFHQYLTPYSHASEVLIQSHLIDFISSPLSQT